MCGSEVTREIKRLEVEFGQVPPVLQSWRRQCSQ